MYICVGRKHGDKNFFKTYVTVFHLKHCSVYSSSRYKKCLATKRVFEKFRVFSEFFPVSVTVQLATNSSSVQETEYMYNLTLLIKGTIVSKGQFNTIFASGNFFKISHDTGSKFATSINDNGGKFCQWFRWCR